MALLQQILSAPPNYIPKKDGEITSLELRSFSIIQRAKNWTMEMSKRDDNRMHDVVSYHYKYF